MGNAGEMVILKTPRTGEASAGVHAIVDTGWSKHEAQPQETRFHKLCSSQNPLVLDPHPLKLQFSSNSAS